MIFLKKLKYLPLALFVALSVLAFLKSVPLGPRKEESPPSPFNITIHDTGLEFQVVIQPATSDQVRKATVQELFGELDIKLYPQDSICPSLKTPLSSHNHIFINRQVFKRNVSIPFETRYIKDGELLYGREALREAGAPGLKEETYSIRSEQANKEQILEEKILNPPKPKIIARGTKIVPTGFQELGQASWCKPYSGWGYVAAHPIIKRGSRMLVTNLENSRQVVVKIVDWGPDRSVFPERVIDLSPEAFVKLGVPLVMGVIKKVKVEEIQ